MAELVYEDAPQEQAETGAVMSTGDTEPTRIPGNNGKGTLTPFDSARASAAARRRWELKAEAARRGIARAAKQVDSIGREDDLAMVAAIMENQALNAYDPSSKSSAASARLVLDHAYPKPEREPAQEAAPTGDLAELLAAWRSAKAANPALGAQAQALLRGNDGE